MSYMGLQEIKEKYLSFFQSKQHLRLPSFSLVPQNDKSLLLISAGMAPLKPYFTGQEKPPCRRITTCQKCIRTPDIERVGKTARHGTFFEMLGNFSFGDYFKHEAIAWAWEFATEVMGLQPERLYPTVYEEDDEAFEIWNKEIGVSADHICRFGKEDNFWEIGVGPCGPCSELLYDRGPERGCGKPDCKPGCDCDRYVEFWNLVFTQFYRDEDGNYTPLEQKNIDTGMGLERLAVIMQEVDNIFEVDTIRRVLEKVCEIAGKKYGENEKDDVSIRIITDHARSTTFMVSDGITAANEGRGYVLKRLLRRAARHGKLLGIEGKFLTEVVKTVIEENYVSYPELKEKEDYILHIIETEEERFYNTIDQGLEILKQYIEEAKLCGNILAGDKAFKLYDTYGFPIDLTQEITDEAGISIDTKGFEALMLEQKERARSARAQTDYMGYDDSALTFLNNISEPTSFIGYTEAATDDATVIAVLNEDGFANAGMQACIVLDKTPFYGESGGQTGDTGIISCADMEFEVSDVVKLAGKFVHKGIVRSGSIKAGDRVHAEINVERRAATARNHTATHLLQAALRSVLGTHVEQSGSFVCDKYLRFDFSHFTAMTTDELLQVEKLVNEAILKNMQVTTETMAIDDAKKLGAMALFGEKYGDTVRVVRAGDFSTELCGGTHVNATGCIGLFKIMSESGVAAGVRRIEAITGMNSYEYLMARDTIISNTAAELRSNESNIIKKITALQTELKETKKALEEARMSKQATSFDDLIAATKKLGNISFTAGVLDGADMNILRKNCDKIRDKIKCGVAVLVSECESKLLIVAAATDDAVANGINCSDIIKACAKTAGGNGGGRPNMAQASCPDISKKNDIIATAENIIKACAE